MSVSVKDVSGILVLAALGIGAVWLVRKKAGAVVNAVNPVNPDNVFNTAAKNVVGEQRLQGGFDRVFAGIDLINPFNESDDYAKQVIAGGMGFDYTKWLDFDFSLPDFTLPQWTESINPASQNNVINKGVTAVVGEKNMSTAGDYFFGLIDLINPFNKSDDYAKTVYGLDEDSRVLKNQKSEGISE